MNARLLCGLIAASLTLAACSKSNEAPPAEKTRAQKDSAIANSSLPGAATVGSAMKVADSAKARQAAIDSANKP